jgi:hypothetical protein
VNRLVHVVVLLLVSIVTFLVFSEALRQRAREKTCMASCTSCPELNTQKCQELCR